MIVSLINLIIAIMQFVAALLAEGVPPDEIRSRVKAHFNVSDDWLSRFFDSL